MSPLKPFSTETYGKWILAGEHAVLRGCPAMAFPLTSRHIKLDFRPGTQSLDVRYEGEHGADLKLLFHGVIESAMKQLGITQPLLGSFILHSTLPVGTGLGASAALCGAVARWCHSQAWIGDDQIYEFARSLEDLFHGESSGVDLAVSLSGQGIRFIRNGEQTVIRTNWWPKLFLSYSGQRGMTSECVAKVKRLFETSPKLAQKLDLQMQNSVEQAEKALLATESVGFPMLKESLEQARACFEQWGLCNGDLAAHIRTLIEAGAVAAKPTGSGGGGFVLSLWSDNPPVSLQPLLVPTTQTIS